MGHTGRSMGSLAELVKDCADEDEVLTTFVAWAEDQGLSLYPAQEEALLEILAGSNVILSTPTGSGKSLVALGAHAASQTEVAIDMSRVLRIDFPFTAPFFDAIKAIQLAGKRVILTHLSELNAALLEALGVNRYAILVRRKST